MDAHHLAPNATAANPRLATMADVPALNQLIATSARALSVGFYSNDQIEALIRHVFGVDSQLIADET